MDKTALDDWFDEYLRKCPPPPPLEEIIRLFEEAGWKSTSERVYLNPHGQVQLNLDGYEKGYVVFKSPGQTEIVPAFAADRGLATFKDRWSDAEVRFHEERNRNR